MSHGQLNENLFKFKENVYEKAWRMTFKGHIPRQEHKIDEFNKSLNNCYCIWNTIIPHDYFHFHKANTMSFKLYYKVNLLIINKVKRTLCTCIWNRLCNIWLNANDITMTYIVVKFTTGVNTCKVVRESVECILALGKHLILLIISVKRLKNFHLVSTKHHSIHNLFKRLFPVFEYHYFVKCIEGKSG